MSNVVLLIGSERDKRVALAEAALTIMQQGYNGVASIVAASKPIPGDVDGNAIIAAGQLVERANTSVKICREPDSLVILCDWFMSPDLFGKVDERLRSLCISSMVGHSEFDIKAVLAIDRDYISIDGLDECVTDIGYDPRGLAIILAYMVGMDLDAIRH